MLSAETIFAQQTSGGAPIVTSLSRDHDRLEGGAQIVIRGKNFKRKTLVILGDRVVERVKVESATRIRFRVPPQQLPGNRTLTVQTSKGIAQRAFAINAKALTELANGEITTIAGGVPFVGDGGLATQASFGMSFGAIFVSIAIDQTGNLIIGDLFNYRVRRINLASGIINTIAGNGARGFAGDNALAISASFTFPSGVATDSAGNLIIADTGNHRIRRVDANTGIVTTVAGNGIRGFSGDGGPAVNANLIFPSELAVDKQTGNIFIADIFNSRIRRIDVKTGIIDTVVGNGRSAFSGDGGPATSAGIDPAGIVLDPNGNLFIADFVNNRIRRVDAHTGIITTVVGNGETGSGGDGGAAINASLNQPFLVALDSGGNLFCVDSSSNRVRRVDARTGIITTVAGNGRAAFSGDGGLAIDAGLSPGSIAIDSVGNLFIADNDNNRIRRIDAATGIINTIAGDGTAALSGDGGQARQARLVDPEGIALDSINNIFIADTFNNRIRRIDASTGVITTVAGDGVAGFRGDQRPANEASFNLAADIAVDRDGNLFIADIFNNRVRRREASSSTITTYAGSTSGQEFAGDGGPAVNAKFFFPAGVALDQEGNLFIADSNNNRIRRVDINTGIVATVAGRDKRGFDGDGQLAIQASLDSPVNIALDRQGNLYIADFFNARIRRVDALTGIITTIAGNGNANFSGDGGLAVNAGLRPASIAVDAAGNLFILDADNRRVRRVDSSTGIITTVVGNGIAGYRGDGSAAISASIDSSQAIVLDKAGNLYIADNFNNAIRVVKGIGMTEKQPAASCRPFMACR
ncbi:MAG: IPT/TIG domain-containing protein [Acidobacteriota bacterium]